MTVTASNSEMAKVASTFIHLKLVLDEGDGQLETVPMGNSHHNVLADRRYTIFYQLLLTCTCVPELSIAQFYQFLQEMEKAKSIIDYLG